MRTGSKVRCIDAKEQGIPITEGATYTVKQIGDPEQMTIVEIAERAHIRCVTLEEVPGYFMASRFELAE